MQTVAHLNSVTLHPSHRSKYVRLRLANGVLFIEGSIDDDKTLWSDLIEKRQLFDEPVAGRILQDIRRSRKEASSKFEKAALKEIERMFIIMRGQNAMKTKKQAEELNQRLISETPKGQIGHIKAEGVQMFFNNTDKPVYLKAKFKKGENTGTALDVWMRSPCCDAPPCAQFKGTYTCAQCKKAYTKEMSCLAYHREDFDIKPGKTTLVPQMSLFRTAELIDELKRRGLNIFSKEIILTYRLKQGKKLQSIEVLYGKVPEHLTDLTKLSFMKADFDPSRLNVNEGYFKCIQFEWVFIAPLDEFIPFCSRLK